SVPADQVSLDFSGNTINVLFPRGKAAPAVKAATAATTAAAVKAPAISTKAEVKEVKKTAPKVSKDTLNEDYLNRLMDENKAPKKEVSRRDTDIPPLKKEATKDAVSLKQA